MDNSKKRKRADKSISSGFSIESITTSKKLEGLLGDFSSPEELNNGVQQFKAFLGRCSKGDDVSEEGVKQNLKVLKEWLENQIKNAGNREEEEDQGNAFRSILQVCSYASQNNSLSVLSVTMASLALLVRTCSQNEELRTCGTVLCKAILQPAYLKIVYRNLVSSKDHITSPTLRMLTEINKFDFGSICGLLHSAFDFTTKDITKNFEVRGVKGDITVATDDLHRPSLRTTFVRFFLSFFQYGSSSVKNEVLGQRAWVSALFKHLRLDSPLVVYDILETLDKKVLADKEIPRATKTNIFYEWALNHILALYSRTDIIKITRLGRDEEKKVNEFSHEFLTKICTTPGNGICFPDLGWYPLGSGESDEKHHGVLKVYNRALSSFILNIRPFADTLQQDLLLEIFKACPELVANYFLSNTSFSFDPKLTSTWIGYYTFLSSTIQLPVPNNFGMGELSAIPPPINLVIENVVPKPLSKATLTKCLLHENPLIGFFITRLLVLSFQKFRRILSSIDDASTLMVDPSSNWTKARYNLAEEFCKRMPDMTVVIGLLNSTPKGKGQVQGKLQKEAASRLLADYYELIPEVALAGKFDITIALGSFLAGGDSIKGDDRGLKTLEMGHLLRVANDVPDIKWWNKSASQEFSPFVSILKICCGPASDIPLRQIRNLLHSFVAPSNLFQNNTQAPPLEALLESLSSIQNPLAINAVLSFLDESAVRCIRSPFKYIDDFAELALGIMRLKALTGNIPPVSPLIMTLVEQWEFFMQSKSASTIKHAASIWLVRFLESSAILGENKYVLAMLCDRLAATGGDSGHLASNAIFGTLKSQLEGGKYLELVNDRPHAIMPGFELNGADTPNFQVKCPRELFNGIGYLDIDSVELVTNSIKEFKIEVSLFDIAVAQKAILGVLDSQKISCENSCSALSGLMNLLEVTLARFKEEGEDSSIWRDAKKMLATNSEWVKSFLGLPVEVQGSSTEIQDFRRYAYFSKRYLEVLANNFNGYEPVLSDICERVKHSLENMGHYFEHSPSDSYRSEVLSTYHTTIARLFSSNGILDFIRNILMKDDPNELEFDILVLLLQQLPPRKKYLPIKDLEALLETTDVPKTLCEALTEYIISTPKDKVASLDAGPYNMNFEAELHEWTISLDCALIMQVESVRNTALVTLERNLRNGKNIPHLSRYLSALLEGFSVPKQGANTFEWDKSVDTEIKQKMERLFSAAHESMFDGLPDAAQIEVLQRVASLFNSLDKKRVLKHVTSDNRKSTFTAKTVTLLDTLIRDISTEELESAELRSWLLMVFDHLTRRFAEDEVLSEKIVDFTKQLGLLLNSRKINLTSSIPRVMLNATLETSLLKHIHVPEVVYFVTVIVSKLSAKFLDLAKLLQIILGHSQNPLRLRDSYFSTQEITHRTAYLIYRLFSLERSRQSNVTTLDGVLALYRGSNDIIDTALLDIVTEIEAHLARSCATRITSWSVEENAGGTPLISRTRGRLTVAIDAKTLARSVLQSSPNKPVILRAELEELDSFMAAAKIEDEHFHKTYDLEFILPVLAFLLSDGQAVDVQAVIERHCLGLAIVGLCSDRIIVRKMAIGYIGSIVAKLEDSTYREKTQMLQLLCALLASINTKEIEDSQPGLKHPIPTITGVFVAQAVLVVANPAHFLYEKVMMLLLRAPLLDLYDLPHMLQIPALNKEEEYQKEITWILNVLTAGLRTIQDLDIYRKRKVFGSCLNLYISPYSTDRAKEKIIELLWNTAGIEGGGTTLITRNGVLSFIEQQQHSSNEKDGTVFKRLAARLYESSAKRHVNEWGMGNIESHLIEGIFVN